MDTNRALAWITNVFAVQGRELRSTDTRATVPEWDSLGDLLLLSMLEEELHIVVSADEIAEYLETGEWRRPEFNRKNAVT